MDGPMNGGCGRCGRWFQLCSCRFEEINRSQNITHIPNITRADTLEGRRRLRALASPCSRAHARDMGNVQSIANRLASTARHLRRPHREPKSERPKCGARTRAGGLCKAPRYRRPDGRVSPKCRMHGSLGGPRTPEGKARSLAALAKFNAERKRK